MKNFLYACLTILVLSSSAQAQRIVVRGRGNTVNFAQGGAAQAAAFRGVQASAFVGGFRPASAFAAVGHSRAFSVGYSRAFFPVQRQAFFAPSFAPSFGYSSFAIQAPPSAPYVPTPPAQFVLQPAFVPSFAQYSYGAYCQ